VKEDGQEKPLAWPLIHANYKKKEEQIPPPGEGGERQALAMSGKGKSKGGKKKEKGL